MTSAPREWEPDGAPQDPAAAPPPPFDADAAAGALLTRFGPRVTRQGRPTFLKVRARPDGSFQTSTVTGRGGLLGVTVGPTWEAAAMVGTGRIRMMDEEHEPPAVLVPGMAGGLLMTCVVSRRGCIGWRMRLPDGSRFDPVPEEGFMLDVLRRSLQLDTPPPPASMAMVLLAGWVATIRAPTMLAGDVGHVGRRLTWEQVLQLHPALIDEPPRPPILAEMAICTAADAAEWEAMRLLVAAGVESANLPAPELAHWMDEGMFARWVLSGLPPAAAMVEGTRGLMEPAAYRRLVHLARSLDDRASAR